MKTYTAAVIGAGTGGQLSMAALANSPSYELVAVADLSLEARAAASARYPNINAFSSYQQLLSDCPTDIICVATWPTSHLEIAHAAVACDLTGILVEKPMAETAVNGRQILNAVQARRLPVAVPHNLLVMTHIREILARVNNGEIGDLRLVEIECSGWDIINAGIHWLNFVITLAAGDQPVSVLTAIDKTSRTYRDGMQVETEAVTYVQFESGMRVVMHTGDYIRIAEPGRDTLFRLIGTQGSIDFYAWQSCYSMQNAQFPNRQLIDVSPAASSGHQLHLDRLAEQMRLGVADYTVAESSLAALELCEAAYLSATHGCVVNLPLSAFSPPPNADWHPGRAYLGHGGGRDGRRLPKKT